MITSALGYAATSLAAFGDAELMAVQDQEVGPLDPGLDDLGDDRPDVEAVGVAPHRLDRGDRLELGQDARRPDVPGMKNEVHPFERLEDLGAQHAVGVGDDAEPHQPCHRGASSIGSSSWSRIRWTRKSTRSAIAFGLW